jgi:hypothetical protein
MERVLDFEVLFYRTMQPNISISPLPVSCFKLFDFS